MAGRPVEDVLRIEDLTVSQHEDTEQSIKEDALRKELDGVRNLNKVMEGVIAAMTKAKDNMDVHRHTTTMLMIRLLVPPWRTQIDYLTFGSKF